MSTDYDQYMEQAKVAQGERNWDAAIKLWKRAIKAYPRELLSYHSGMQHFDWMRQQMHTCEVQKGMDREGRQN